jgi:hypothetical protein
MSPPPLDGAASVQDPLVPAREPQLQETLESDETDTSDEESDAQRTYRLISSRESWAFSI